MKVGVAQDWLRNERTKLNVAVETASAAMREAGVQIRELKERIAFLENENEKLRQEIGLVSK